jgi:hypothetical protein
MAVKARGGHKVTARNSYNKMEGRGVLGQSVYCMIRGKRGDRSIFSLFDT